MAFLGATPFYTAWLFLIRISRHTIVCRAAQEAGASHRYIDRKKENIIFTPLYPYPIGTKFAAELPVSYGSPHSKFEGNCSRVMSSQNFGLFSSSFFLLRVFAHLQKLL